MTIGDVINALKERYKDKIIDLYEKSPKRIYVTVKGDEAKEMARFLFEEQGGRLATASGVDTRRGIEILYHFAFDKLASLISLKAIVSKPFPQIESISTFLPGAEWIEREIHDLLGVNFIGHPDLKRLILAEDWPEGKYPLRREEE